MNILNSISPKTEVYSIDEAFLDFSGTEKNIGCFDFGLHLKNTVERWTGIPVRIGIGPYTYSYRYSCPSFYSIF